MVMGDSVSLGRTVLELGTENSGIDRGMEAARVTVTRQMEAMGRVSAETMRGVQQQIRNTSDAWFKQRDAALSAQHDINAGLGVHRDQVKSAEESWKAFEQAQAQANQRAIEGMRQQAEAMSQLGLRMTAGGAALTAPAALAVASAIGFETSMARVEKTSGLTGSALDALGREFRDLATDEIPMSASALADIGAMAAQMGVRAQDLGVFTETVAKLATATDIVGDQGAANLARFINVMGETYGQIENISSAIVDLGNNSAATESEILAMSLRVGAAGRQIGMSTGDVLGLSAAMTSLGLESQMGGTAISRVILAIYSAAQQGADGLRDFADVAGMTAEQYQALVASDPTEALTRFIGGLGEAESKGHNIIKVLDDLSFGNIRIRDTLLRLAGAQDLMNDSVDRGTDAYRENVALQREFEVFQATTAAQWEITKNNMTEMAIVAGTVLLPATNAVLGVLQDVLGVLADMPAPAQGLVVGLAAVAGLMAITGGAALLMAGQVLQARVAMMQLGLTAKDVLVPALGPAGVAGAIALVGVAADAILKKTTGHGLIDWLFRDPRSADAAAESIKRVNAELEAAGKLDDPKARLAATREQVALEAERYRLAKLANEERNKDPGGLRGGYSDNRGMKEARAAIEELFKSLDDAQVPFSTLRHMVAALDAELVAAAQKGITDYDIRLKALMATTGDLTQAQILELHQLHETASAMDGVTTAAQRARNELQAMGMELAASTILGDFGIAALNAGEARDAAIGRLRDAFYGEFANKKAIDDLIAEAMQGMPQSTISSTGGAGGDGVGGYTPARTALESLLDLFTAFGERAPSAMARARAELDLYRAAAQKAGDTTAVGLIDSLLRIDPTVADISASISALQAQYGDLGAAANAAARVQEQAVSTAATAWNTLQSTAQSSVEVLGTSVIDALRRQAQAASAERVRVLRETAGALLAPLQAQLDALDAQAVADERGDIRRELEVTYDPRKREDLRKRLADIDKRVLRGSLEEQMQDIKDDLAEKERTEAESLARATETWKLQLDARTLILSGNLAEIGELLKGQEGAWSMAGKSLGEAIVGGLNPPLDAWMGSLASRLAALGVGSYGDGTGPTGNVGRSAQTMIAEIARAKAGGAPAFAVDAMRDAFASTFGFAAPLAQGGVITRPTFALLGETAGARPEIATPQRLMADTFRGVLRDEGTSGPLEVRLVATDPALAWLTQFVRVEVREESARGLVSAPFEGGVRR